MPESTLDKKTEPDSPDSETLMSAADWDRCWRRPAWVPVQSDNRYDHGGRSWQMKRIARLLEGIELGTITSVELGCGTGLITRCLFDNYDVKSAVAVDFSPQAVAKARVNAQGRNIRVIQADLTSWQTDERFDLAISAGLIEHFAGSALDGIIRLHHDLLKPDGHAIIMYPRRGLLWPVLRAFNRLQGINEEPPRDAFLFQLLEKSGLHLLRHRRFVLGMLLGLVARRAD
ncbi:MAG: methyltransferase domain-containing protein [candidate division WOR-3 bacterium]